MSPTMNRCKPLTSLLTLAAAMLALAGLTVTTSAQAETVVSVTQTSYDYLNHPVCSTVRMNPAVYGSVQSDPCVLGTEGSNGPDRITQNVYDAAGQVVQIWQAVGTPAQRTYATYAYSNNGLVTDSIDANGNRSHNDYDGFDRLSKAYYPSDVRSAYNPSTPATALSTANSYNSADYLQYTYDDNNNIKTLRVRDGQLITYSYDNLNRQVLKDVPGSDRDVYTSYDALGHVAWRRFNPASAASGISYYYDPMGRLAYTTDMNGRTVWYGYNQANARLQLTFPDFNAIDYTVDAANRLSTMGWNATSGLYSQSYNNQGGIAVMTKGAASTSYTYDAFGRVQTMANSFTSTSDNVTWTFTYNPAGQLASSSASSTIYDYKETAQNYDPGASVSFDGRTAMPAWPPTAATTSAAMSSTTCATHQGAPSATTSRTGC